MHTRLARLFALSLFPAAASFAQPVVSLPAVNSASYRTAGMPGAGIAQGSIFTIFGTGLGPATATQAYTFPLQPTLGGASVTVTVGGDSVSAIMLFAYSTQINAVLPSNTPVGSGTFTVSYNGQTSAPAAIQVVSSAFGAFTYNSSGSGQAIATDVNYALNTIIHTFHPGDYGILWGTGLGAITGSETVAPPVGSLPGPITVYVGNAPATVVYQGRAGCCAGLDQIVFQIPAGVTGCYVPIGVQAGGVQGNVGNIPTIAVSDSGQTCTDSVMGQPVVNQLAAGQTVSFGYVRLESLIAHFVPGSVDNAEGDFAMATFSQYTPGNAGLAEYGVSSGYCIAVGCSSATGCAVDSGNASLSDSSPAQLDAGSLSVQYAPPITLSQYGGFYLGDLAEAGNRYLWSGLTYPMTGAGGSAVGAFNVNDMTSLPGVSFSSITSGQTVPLSGDLTVEWSGGDPTLQNGQVTIGGYSSTDTTYTQFQFIQCTAPLAAGKFTIPGWVLASLPRSGTGETTTGEISYPLGWIWIGQYNKPTMFNATGLTSGIITDIFYNGLGVFFQ